MPFLALPAVFATTLAMGSAGVDGQAEQGRASHPAWSQPLPVIVDQTPHRAGLAGLAERFIQKVENGDRKGLELVCDRILGCAPGTAFSAAWRGHPAELRSPRPAALEVASVGIEALLVGSNGAHGLSIDPLVFASGLGIGVETTF
jgi:hypothetical protein